MAIIPQVFEHAIVVMLVSLVIKGFLIERRWSKR